MIRYSCNIFDLHKLLLMIHEVSVDQGLSYLISLLDVDELSDNSLIIIKRLRQLQLVVESGTVVFTNLTILSTRLLKAKIFINTTLRLLERGSLNEIRLLFA